MIGKRVKHLYSYIQIDRYYKFCYRICLTKDWHSCELVLSLSPNGLTQIVNSSGFSLKLFHVLCCTIVLCWCSGGLKLQLCHSTVQILMRQCLLQSFLIWVTVVQVSYLFSTLNCSKTYSFWVCLLLLDSYIYAILKIVLKNCNLNRRENE